VAIGRPAALTTSTTEQDRRRQDHETFEHGVRGPGSALIAISFGLARFAFGLFVPPIREELGLGSSVIGIIGALPLISFLLATAVAPLVTRRLGARYTAVLSGGFGVAGLSLISRAADPLMLGAGVFACGICTGLMMPALTAAMQAIVRRSLHGRVSSVINAGTSIGVIVAVPTCCSWSAPGASPTSPSPSSPASG
jgi:MFS transporter, DHA1 family, inner membrane transport protein